MAMRTKPTPSRLNHHSGLRDESQLAIVAPMSSLPVARGRGATGGKASYALEVKVRGGASGAARAAGCWDDLAAPEASLINWSTDRCSAATAFSIRERRATIASSLDGSIIAAPRRYSPLNQPRERRRPSHNITPAACTVQHR